jgi:Domain of unknown function (DUF5130)
VATGEHVPEHVPAGELVRRVDEELPPGTVIMPHGRVSAARELRPNTKGPFTPVQLARLDEALTLASRASRLPFSLYLGELGPNTRARAEELHAATPDPAHAVLIAVSPGQRVVEVVTGEESSRRLPNHACRLAVMAMVASFKEGDLAGGLVSGLRMLSDQAGTPQAPRTR